MMGSNNFQTQFTQTLMLFVGCNPHSYHPPHSLASLSQQSQTQSGMRYTPSLTRFFSSTNPSQLLQLITSALTSLGVKLKAADPERSADGSSEKLRLRIGGYDARKEVFKGWVELETFTYRGDVGSFCVMQRDQVSCML